MNIVSIALIGLGVFIVYIILINSINFFWSYMLGSKDVCYFINTNLLSPFLITLVFILIYFLTDHSLPVIILESVLCIACLNIIFILGSSKVAINRYTGELYLSDKINKDVRLILNVHYFNKNDILYHWEFEGKYKSQVMGIYNMFYKTGCFNLLEATELLENLKGSNIEIKFNNKENSINLDRLIELSKPSNENRV